VWAMGGPNVVKHVEKLSIEFHLLSLLTFGTLPDFAVGF
jgi:hypothetical protein